MKSDATRKGVSMSEIEIATQFSYLDDLDQIVAMGAANRAAHTQTICSLTKTLAAVVAVKKKPRRKPCNRTSAFERSPEWKALRETVFDKYGRECQKCGSGDKPNCDHIKPKSRYPELALEFDNIQVLCWPCNKAKGTRDQTDYRGSRA